MCTAVGRCEELHSTLERVLSSYFGSQQRVARLQCRPLPYHSSFSIRELTVDLEAGRRLEIICKGLGITALLDSARRVKPAFLHDPLREIEVYRWILAPYQLGATFYGAATDSNTDSYWLLLEKVEGSPLWEIGEFATWKEAARWLAAFHNRWAEVPRVEAGAPNLHLLQCTAEFYEGWLSRAEAFARPQAPAIRQAVGAVLRTYQRSIDRLVQMRPSVIHGDFYASNILVQRTNAVRICPVDWELAAIGPPLVDLAALIAGRWTERQKAALTQSYYATLGPDRRCGRDYEGFLRDLDCCRLHLAVQWLGWSPEWIPPAEHAQDWLGEAVRLAKRIDA